MACPHGDRKLSRNISCSGKLKDWKVQDALKYRKNVKRNTNFYVIKGYSIGLSVTIVLKRHFFFLQQFAL